MKIEIGPSMPRKSRHGCKLARREHHRLIKAEARRGRGTAVRRVIAEGYSDWEYPADFVGMQVTGFDV